MVGCLERNFTRYSRDHDAHSPRERVLNRDRYGKEDEGGNHPYRRTKSNGRSSWIRAQMAIAM